MVVYSTLYCYYYDWVLVYNKPAQLLLYWFPLQEGISKSALAGCQLQVLIRVERRTDQKNERTDAQKHVEDTHRERWDVRAVCMVGCTTIMMMFELYTVQS